MNRLWLFSILGGIVALFGVFLLQQHWEEKERFSQYVTIFEHGNHLELNHRPAEAALIYQGLLDQDTGEFELSDEERAKVCYRLAGCQVEGNDLPGALGTLHSLSENGAAQGNYDLGPLYLKLAEKAHRSNRHDLARIANRQGAKLSPERYESFSRQLDEMTREMREKKTEEDS